MVQEVGEFPACAPLAAGTLARTTNLSRQMSLTSFMKSVKLFNHGNPDPLCRTRKPWFPPWRLWCPCAPRPPLAGAVCCAAAAAALCASNNSPVQSTLWLVYRWRLLIVPSGFLRPLGASADSPSHHLRISHCTSLLCNSPPITFASHCAPRLPLRWPASAVHSENSAKPWRVMPGCSSRCALVRPCAPRSC